MRIRSRLLNKLLSFFAVLLIRFIYRTCRAVVHMEAENTNPYFGTGDDRYLYSIWHDQILMTLFTGNPIKMSGLVSRHQDGSYVAAAMKAQDIQAVRGSSSKGGAAALRALLDEVRDRHVAITPDGPRGPRHKAKAGLLFLAAQTGRQIVAATYTCKRMWRIRGSWTDMMIPKPFTTIYYTVMKPFSVPADLGRKEIRQYVQKLQDEMTRSEEMTERLAAGQELCSESETEVLQNAA